MILKQESPESSNTDPGLAGGDTDSVRYTFTYVVLLTTLHKVFRRGNVLRI